MRRKRVKEVKGSEKRGRNKNGRREEEGKMEIEVERGGKKKREIEEKEMKRDRAIM